MLETSRLQIRKFESSDYEHVLEYMTDGVATYYLGEGQLSADQVINFITNNSGDKAKAFPVIDKSCLSLIGHIEFYPWFDNR